MEDQAAWDQALDAAGKWYAGLTDDTRAGLDSRIDSIMLLKQQLVESAVSSGSPGICRECGGECCLLGKYHVSVLDILAYLRSGADLPTPDFTSAPFCPYSDSSGCLMPSRFRPLTCVVFNCGPIEERMTPAELEIFRRHETGLRKAVADAARISGLRIDRPLLLSFS